MPIVQALMDKLVKQYGEERAKRVYYAMESEGSGPFGPKGKHRDMHEAFVVKHGLPGPNRTGKRKAATPKGRRPRVVRRR